MQQRAILDETFDAMRTSGYDLLVRPSLQGISLALIDPVRKMFIGLVDFPYQITSNDAWEDAYRYLAVAYPWVENEFKSVTISWRSQAATLAPKSFFDPDRAKQMMKRIASVEDLDEIHAQEIYEQSVMLFTVPSQLLYDWRSAQGALRIVNEDAALLKLLRLNQKKGKRLLLHLRDHYVTAALVNVQEIEAFLPFVAQVPEDVLFHVVSILEARGIEPLEIRYKVQGQGLAWRSDSDPRKVSALSASAIESLLSSYFLPIDQRLTLHGFEFSYLLEKFQQSHLPLFALALCE